MPSVLESTFEELRKVQLAEKHSALLSALPHDFYQMYKRILETNKPTATGDLSLETVKLYSNALAVLKDIASIRSHKILLRALREQRSTAQVPDGFAKEEIDLYQRSLNMLREFDESIAGVDLTKKAPKTTTMVEILSDLPEFIFNNAAVGPFKQGDRTELAIEIAQLLIRRGAAKEASG